MLLRRLFGRKKTKPKTESSQAKEDASVEKPEQPAKRTDENVVYPFHDVKATSFPPPLALDAAVHTDLRSAAPPPPEGQKEKYGVEGEKKVDEKDTKQESTEIKDETKDEKTQLDANGTCDLKTCTRDKSTHVTCEKGSRPSKKAAWNESEEKISPSKLTEMINSSIKEAVQTIVKQCTMQEEKGLDKKPKDKIDKLVCKADKEVIPGKVKHEHRPRTTQEQLDRSRISNSNRLQRYNRVPYPKRVHEEATRSRCKKDSLLEEVRSKRHSKSANSRKTDNRRMTGNVNIYICSEATENTQGTIKQKKPQPCTESSSETTTEQSRISSSKLVTCIRNKRGKSKQQDSLCFPPKKEDSSDDSTTCSCVSKYAESKSATKLDSSNSVVACSNINKDVCVNSTESTLSDCECKETNISSTVVAVDKSDLSFEKSRFVLCDKREKPCSTIYASKSLSNSESEGWSSKSAYSSRNVDCVPSNAWSLEPNLTCRSDESEKRGVCKRTHESAYKFHKNDREYGTRCNCGSKSRPSRIPEKESWLICNCITEEEEGDVCIDAKASEEPAKHVPADFCKDAETLQKGEKEQIPEKEVDKKETPKVGEEERIRQLSVVQEADQRRRETAPKIPTLGMSGKMIRPETMVLKDILQQQAKSVETGAQEIASPAPVKPADTLVEAAKDRADSKHKDTVSPSILKKFDLHIPFDQLIKLGDEEMQAVPGEKHEKALEEKETMKEKSKRELPEDKGDKQESGMKNVQGKIRDTNLFKGLKKMIGKGERPETKSEGFTGKDKVGDINDDKTGTEKPQTPEKSKSGTKEKSIASKLYSYMPMRLKKSKPEGKTVASTNSPVNKDDGKGNKADKGGKNNPADNPSSIKEKSIPANFPSPIENAKEDVASDVRREQQSRSKLLTNIGQKNPPVVVTENTAGKLAKQGTSEESKIPESEENARKQERDGPLRSQFGEKPDADERRQAEPQKIATREEKSTKRMHVDANSEREAATVCMKPHKMKPHTICTNSKFAKCARVDERFPPEENMCNCCCLSVPQRSNEPINYPKSCLKKERQCCRMDSQENNCSGPYRDKRNWEECGCRRVAVCNGCCRPRSECRRAITCVTCCKPKNKCICKSMYEGKNACGCMKSMFCLYCDNSRDKCTCRAPVRKCSCCELSVDLCMCKHEKMVCDGRPVLTEPADDDRTMYVTAWKPREEVRRYFSRNLTDLRTDSVNECCCCEKLKPHNSDDLPYQRLSVFSDVMDELQQKMSESTCCTRCKKIPCCCNIMTERNEGREDRKIKYCISPKTRRKIIAVCMEKSRNKLANSCKCESSQTKSDKQKKIIVALCCACQASPCRCSKPKPSQKKPKAKCYYCKTSPCICIAARERNKSRSCRCTDSPCRSKEKESTSRGKTSTKPRNNDEKTICVR